MKNESDHLFEMYGPIMIRNGFLRDSEGYWRNLSMAKMLTLRKLEMGPKKGNWGIFFEESEIDSGFHFSFLNCKERYEAQQFLDHLLNGGVIRFEDKIPVMTGN